MSLFLLRPAVFLLATLFACPAHADPASTKDRIFGPDSNGDCYEGSPVGATIPCPTQVRQTLPKAAIAGIAVAVLFVIVLLVALLLWRRQVRNTTDDSASSLFDFVSAPKGSDNRRPDSPHSSIQTMVGSESVHEKEAYFRSRPEGSIETVA